MARSWHQLPFLALSNAGSSYTTNGEGTYLEMQVIQREIKALFITVEPAIQSRPFDHRSQTDTIRLLLIPFKSVESPYAMVIGSAIGSITG